MDPSSPAVKRLLAMVDEQYARMDREQGVIVDGFALAFKDATGFDPTECEMIVEQVADSDAETGVHKMIQRIYFRRRTK